MEAVAYYVALVTVVVFPPPILMWFLIHPLSRHWQRIGPWGTYLAVFTLILLGMVSIWSIRGRLLATSFGFSIPLTIAAAILLVVTIYIRVRWRQVIPKLTILGLPQLARERTPGKLITKGIYSQVRHPRYLEVGLSLAAIALFSNYLTVYILAIAYVPTIYAVVVLEERELRNRFGAAHEEYCRKVPRFFPRRRQPPHN